MKASSTLEDLLEEAIILEEEAKKDGEGGSGKEKGKPRRRRDQAEASFVSRSYGTHGT